ncbi:serine hydrolase [Acrocarpospora pleiomorpha]|uniref:serine hydrolase n=1 Tax=Acrocarpospora pleiomorpha TaxID=90975 RepID=UPI0012D300D4|nr:serine hydrolase [Acrocarpospora pleiomorpha]
MSVIMVMTGVPGAVALPRVRLRALHASPDSKVATVAKATFSTSSRANLTRNLATYLKDRSGQASIQIHDLSTGITYGYNTGLRTVTASIVKVDILAALLLRAQQDARKLTATERNLAKLMITLSDNDAATTLWNQIGGAPGLATANRKLGLRDTTPGPGGYWGSTTTSAADQLRILRSLTSKTSPLNAESRRYILGLMADVTPAQAWGISAAASDNDTTAVKNGWLPRTADSGRWTINSIGRIHGNGHDYLIAAISRRNSSMPDGITTVEHIAELTVEALNRNPAP